MILDSSWLNKNFYSNKCAINTGIFQALSFRPIIPF